MRTRSNQLKLEFKSKSKSSAVTSQGLMQKEKVRIDCKQGAQISILANKIATQ